MMGNATEALYTTKDPSLKNWSLADPLFLPTRSGAGDLWHPLPRCVAGTESLAQRHTHVYQMAGVGRHTNGLPHFAMCTYDAGTHTGTGQQVTHCNVYPFFSKLAPKIESGDVFCIPAYVAGAGCKPRPELRTKKGQTPAAFMIGFRRPAVVPKHHSPGCPRRGPGRVLWRVWG